MTRPIDLPCPTCKATSGNRCVEQYDRGEGTGVPDIVELKMSVYHADRIDAAFDESAKWPQVVNVTNAPANQRSAATPEPAIDGACGECGLSSRTVTNPAPQVTLHVKSDEAERALDSCRSHVFDDADLCLNCGRNSKQIEHEPLLEVLNEIRDLLGAIDSKLGGTLSIAGEVWGPR